MIKSSPSIWHLLHSVKSTVKILSIFVAFSENINFTFPNILLKYIFNHFRYRQQNHPVSIVFLVPEHLKPPGTLIYTNAPIAEIFSVVIVIFSSTKHCILVQAVQVLHNLQVILFLMKKPKSMNNLHRILQIW